MGVDYTYPAALFAELQRRPALIRVLEKLLAERDFQDSKYGPVTVKDAEGKEILVGGKSVQGRGGHDLAAWAIIVEAELNEVKLAVIHGGFQSATGRNSIRSEFLQVMAVACAALEQHGVDEKS